MIRPRMGDGCLAVNRVPRGLESRRYGDQTESVLAAVEEFAAGGAVDLVDTGGNAIEDAGIV